MAGLNNARLVLLEGAAKDERLLLTAMAVLWNLHARGGPQQHRIGGSALRTGGNPDDPNLGPVAQQPARGVIDEPLQVNRERARHAEEVGERLRPPGFAAPIRGPIRRREHDFSPARPPRGAFGSAAYYFRVVCTHARPRLNRCVTGGDVLRYAAIVTKTGRSLSARFPDCGGCSVSAPDAPKLEREAVRALTAWLSARLLKGGVPPRPMNYHRGKRVLWVCPPARLSIKIQLRWARHDAGLSQVEVARRTGFSQQMVAKVEHPKYRANLDVLEDVAFALGQRLVVGVAPVRSSRRPRLRPATRRS